MAVTMKLFCDSRQQAGKHEAKERWWRDRGIVLERAALTARSHAENPAIAPAGDYCRDGSNVCVDTKRSVDEVAQNINGKAHERFRRECQRARDAGYRLVVLVENELGYENAGDVVRWENGHCKSCPMRARKGREGGCMPRALPDRCERHGTRKPIQGARLYKAMTTMHMRYGVSFEFCAPEDAARRVCELLGMEVSDE